MGQQTLTQFAGGAIYMTPGSNQTIVWWIDRKVQTIKPTAGSLLMTLQNVNQFPAMPEGDDVLILINPKDSSFAWNLRDLTNTFNIQVGIGQAASVARVGDGAGGRKWWPTLWNVL